MKSFHLSFTGRPSATPPQADQAAVESLRSAAHLARVGLWPPPRRG